MLHAKGAKVRKKKPAPVSKNKPDDCPTTRPLKILLGSLYICHAKLHHLMKLGGSTSMNERLRAGNTWIPGAQDWYM